jgi:hypothetical protein
MEAMVIQSYLMLNKHLKRNNDTCWMAVNPFKLGLLPIIYCERREPEWILLLTMKLGNVGTTN